MSSVKGGNSKTKILTLILMCFVLALLLEIFFFNFSYFRYGKVDEIVESLKFENMEQISDGTYMAIDGEKTSVLAIPIQNPNAAKLSFFISSPDTSEAQVSIRNDQDEYGERKIQNSLEVIKLTDHPKEVFLTFTNLGQQKIVLNKIKVSNTFSFNGIRFFVISVLLMILLLVLLGFFKNRYQYFALTIILLFGSILAILMPAGQTMDEPDHILKSFSVAEGRWLFKNDDKLNLPTGMEQLYAEEPFSSYEEFKDIYNKNASSGNSILAEKVSHTSAALNLFVPYLFSGLGIKLAMVFKLPMMFYIWFARIFNVLAYGLLVFFAIKKMPYGKRWMTFFAVQPVMLYSAASLGVDAILVGSIMLGFSQIMRIRFSKLIIKPKEFILIVSCFSLAIVAKVVYAPVVVLYFLLKRDNFKNRKIQWGSYILISLVLFILAISVYKYSSDMGINQWKLKGVSPELQIVNILKNPIDYIKLLTVYFSKMSSVYLQGAFGLMGYLLVINPLIVILIILAQLFLCIVDGQQIQEKRTLYFTPVEKGIVSFSVLSMLILSATALYLTFTTVASRDVNGYQARYLMPMLFLLLSMIPTKNIKSEYSEEFLDRFTFISIISLLTFVFFRILMDYFS